ncbi:Scr1 family TA system antitoxin-like transcriptional regulator [Streptomyces fumanus]|uniref:Scr1 family TA system antitoxin-like transcriptional regulator n=1 Tax=Streptomyces fumanus TaxID=67302 RepID=UPI00340F4AC5
MSPPGAKWLAQAASSPTTWRAHAHGPVPRLDTVHLDSAHGGEFTHSEAQLGKYRAHMDWWQAHTLDPEASRDLMRSIARQL